MKTQEETQGRKEYQRQYYLRRHAENPGLKKELADKKRQRTQDDPEFRKMLAERMRKARAENPEKTRLRRRLYRERNLSDPLLRQKQIDDCRRYHENYKKRDPERYRKQVVARGIRVRSTPKGRLRNRISFAIWSTLRKNKGGRSWTSLLGFSVDDLKKHLESQFRDGMSWELLMSGDIEIDHKIPYCALPHSHPDDENFKKLWALSNLQPLWRWENQAKIYQDLSMKKALLEVQEFATS